MGAPKGKRKPLPKGKTLRYSKEEAPYAKENRRRWSWAKKYAKERQRMRKNGEKIPEAQKMYVGNCIVLANLMTTFQVAYMFGRTLQTIYSWRREKGLPYILLPGDRVHAVRYDAKQVVNWAIDQGKAIFRPHMLQANYKYFHESKGIPLECLRHTVTEDSEEWLEDVSEVVDSMFDDPAICQDWDNVNSRRVQPYPPSRYDALQERKKQERLRKLQEGEDDEDGEEET